MTLKTRSERVQAWAKALGSRFCARRCDHCGEMTLSGHDGPAVACSWCGSGTAIARRRDRREAS